MRLRTLKPGFWTNEYLTQLPFEARLLFQGLWNLADREGRLEDRPLRIKMQIFPVDNVDIDDLLTQLATCEVPFIVRYEIEGKRCIQVLNWHKHQKPHPKEAPSELPEMESREKVEPNREKVEPSKVGSGVLSLGSGVLGDVCSEQSSFTCKIPLKDGSEYEVDPVDVREWQSAFPQVDVRAELRKCRSWNLSNPGKRKTKRGVRKHINAWISSAKPNAPPRKSVEERLREAELQEVGAV